MPRRTSVRVFGMRDNTRPFHIIPRRYCPLVHPPMHHGRADAAEAKHGEQEQGDDR